jgi:hypothetical protein
MDIIELYNEYLAEESKLTGLKRKDKANGRYSASGAGMCLRKHYYKKNDAYAIEIDSKSLRTMRLGTIFGKDIENAMEYYREISKHNMYNDSIWTEGFLEHPTLPICGSFDVLYVDENANGHLIDIKTAHDFKYKGMFGRKKDPNPATNYQMQLGTYAWMLNETKKYCEKVISMELVYFNKNDARMNKCSVPLDFIEIAQDYWEMLFDCDETLPPLGNMVPAYNWECGKYCEYRAVCDSPLIKDKPTIKPTIKEALIA